MTAIAIGAAVLLALLAAGVWVAMRKISAMGEHLPAAIERWEDEIKNLEKPKG